MAVYDPSRQYAHGRPFQNAARPSRWNVLVHVVRTPLDDVWTLDLTNSMGCVKLTAKTAAEPPKAVDCKIVGVLSGLVAVVASDVDVDDDDEEDMIDDRSTFGYCSMVS